MRLLPRPTVLPACLLASAIATAPPVAGAQPAASGPAQPPTPAEPAPPADGEEDTMVLPAEAEAHEETVAPLTGQMRLDADGLVAAEQRAYALYMEGVHALEDAEDPDLAIEKWTEAVSVLPDERPYAASRGALALRLVTAHDLRFRRDGDLADIRRQSALLSGYQQRLPEMFPDDAAARQQRHDHAQVRIDEIATELQRLEGEHGTVEDQLGKSLRGEYQARGEDTWRPDPTDLGWHARRDDPRKRAGQEDDKEEAPEVKPVPESDLPVEKAGTGLLVSGAVATAIGLGGLGVGIAGMVTAKKANDFDPLQTPMDRREQLTRGHAANVQAVVGLTAGSALVVTGVVLLVVGAKKRKRSGSSLAVTPSVGSSFGAVITGRF